MELSDKNKITIFCGGDEHYKYGIYLTIFSICKNTSEELIVNILDCGLSVNSRSLISSLETRFNNIKISFFSYYDDELSKYPTIGHLNSSAYARLKIPDITDRNKVIYIDSDFIILSDIINIWNIDISNHIVAAIRDFSLTSSRHLSYSISDMKLSGTEPVFNTGIMLINVEKWRSNHVSDRASEHIYKYKNSLMAADQDGINVACLNQWLEIDSCWNIQVAAMTAPQIWSEDQSKFYFDLIHSYHKSPKGIHFTGKKPWNDVKYSYFVNFFYTYLFLDNDITLREKIQILKTYLTSLLRRIINYKQKK